MIELSITIATDPADGQLALSMAQEGAPGNAGERIATAYFRGVLEQAGKVFSETMLEQDLASTAVTYTGEHAAREGAAFEQRVKDNAAAWRCERCGKTVAGESRACFCAKCEQEVRR